MTRGEALALLTSNAAYAAFEEKVRGTIAVGKFADFSVFPEDVMAIPEDEIPRVRALMTVIGGVVVYEAAALTPPNASD
jgi:hypothetical protein